MTIYRTERCPGSGHPALDPMPDNVDRWGTCPHCGGIWTSSAPVMANHPIGWTPE